MKYQPTEYEWLNDTNPTSLLTANDICQIYTMPKKALFARVGRGTFPEHDTLAGVGKHHNQKHYWYAATVKKQVINDLTKNKVMV